MLWFGVLFLFLLLLLELLLLLVNLVRTLDGALDAIKSLGNSCSYRSRVIRIKGCGSLVAFGSCNFRRPLRNRRVANPFVLFLVLT
jgi:hypothetical protein